MAEVRLARDDERAACLAVRRTVFIEEQRVEEAIEVDGLDEACAHAIAYADDGRCVGTARLRVTDGGDAKVERVAVLAEARGTGLGHRLMDVIEAEARRRGFTEVVLNAQASVITFYDRRGYAPEGPRFDEAGIEHQKMRRTWG